MLHIDETPVKVGNQEISLGNWNLISDWENGGTAENKTLVYTLEVLQKNKTRKIKFIHILQMPT